MGKVIRCKFCEKRIPDEDAYASHITKKHPEQIIPGMAPRQFVYYLRTGKTAGSCVMCKQPTKWNETTNKYCRFCENPKCKEAYREEFKNRMIEKYGKVTLLDDPEQQKKMLAARKISGVYLWSDHIHKFTYTGTYEKAFLEFLDKIMHFPPTEIFTPSPHIYVYEYEGKKHFYFPDLFLSIVDAEIEIKDGGDNPNMHPKIQEVDKVKEKLKDQVLMSKNIPFHYLKISNKNHDIFFDFLVELNKMNETGEKKKIVLGV